MEGKEEELVTNEEKQYNFYAMLDRMQYIQRWGLMRNTRQENLKEHSFDVAVIAHSLALIHNRILKQDYIDPYKTMAEAIYHDVTEIITGDLPTPIKYINRDLKTAYKEVEAQAANNILNLLPEELEPEYRELLMPDLSDEEKKKIHRLVKAADRISAFLKCLMEEKAGNDEFSRAKQTIEDSIHKLECEEAEYYLAHFVPPYGLTLDEISK
ncbi:MAG: 5'-deoxynucleotidase [Clostridiales bacterium]|nr:5'-deoxynucleotidase [Clostridiales bacterium]